MDPQVPGNMPAGEPYPGPPQSSPQQSAAQPGYAPVNGYTQQPYPPQSAAPNGYQQAYPPPGSIVPADQGLSDTAAGALAYVTIIPAIIFLVMAPYNTRPFVKFHAFQCLALGLCWFCLGIIAIIPILGWITWLVGSLALLVGWVMSLVKASQGSYLKLPAISDFASKQSGYPIL